MTSPYWSSTRIPRKTSKDDEINSYKRQMHLNTLREEVDNFEDLGFERIVQTIRNEAGVTGREHGASGGLGAGCVMRKEERI